MDARGHLGAGDLPQIEQGDTDTDGAGQGAASDLVDTDDEVEALLNSPFSTLRSVSPRMVISSR